MKQLNEYKTPTTNCCSFTVQIDGTNSSVVEKPVCADLERKLAMCRDALGLTLDSYSIIPDSVVTAISEALDQTK